MVNINEAFPSKYLKSTDLAKRAEARMRSHERIYGKEAA